MVQGIMELLFDAAYLVFALVVGIYLIVKGKSKFFKMFGVMAVVLSSGDSFHLIPRVYALLTTGLEANAFALGLGKLITSITMTVFYVILYFILESVWQPDKKIKLISRITLFTLTALRIILCAFPQNEWFLYSTYINNEAKRLNSLSEKLLAISRLDSDNFVDTQQLFSADEQIRNIILSLQIVWTKNNLNFDAELPETYIRSNRDLCYLVWQNLISNAVKYTPVNGNISVKLSEEKNWLIFSITNTGNSLAGKEELIFQSFYTSDSSGKDKGTGLGLPLVKKILQKLGGDITVACTDSTQFTVRLPLT